MRWPDLTSIFGLPYLERLQAWAEMEVILCGRWRLRSRKEFNCRTFEDGGRAYWDCPTWLLRLLLTS